MTDARTDPAPGTETPDTGADADAVAARSLKDRSLYINRELSWLEFNDRVLQLAEDASLPLMERVKFLAIWSSNLDEFFMIRVSGVHDQIEARIDKRGPDGLSPTRTLSEISAEVREQGRRIPHSCVTSSDLHWHGRASGSSRARNPALPTR